VSKVPLRRIPALARALDVDPRKLLQLCIDEYMPELNDVIAEICNGPIVSKNEIKILQAVRVISRNADPQVSSRNVDFLKAFVRHS
jgi:hypothetical protein